MLRGYVDQFFYDTDWQLEPEGWPVEDFVNGQLADDDARDIRTGIEAQFNYKASDELNFLIGGEYYYAALYDVNSKDNYTPSVTSNPAFNFIDLFETDDPWIEETDQHGYSGFGQLHYSPFFSRPDYYFDKFSIIAGLRYDYNDRYDDFWSPRVGIVLGPIENFYLKLLYGKAFRNPNFNEIKAKKQGDVVGNIDLDAEEIDTLESELSLDKWKWLKPRFNIFYNRISNLIVPDPNRLTPPRRFLNLSEDINRYGFELEIRGDLPLNFNYNFNASYVNGDRMDLIPHWRSNLLFGIPFKERFNLIYYLKYIGERNRDSDDDRDEIDPVLLHDLTFTADLLKDRLMFRFDVRNLFDEEYESPDFSGRIEDDYPMNGRSIFGSIQLKTSWGSR
jgi:outer membrane receptor protein involved in Fe transport